MWIRNVLLAGLALGLLPGVGWASADDQAREPGADRPRIGLVLSGGGARGAAHIGVIRALEERHIPIDAVAGTSMGAVVGGLYAAGMTGDEIAEVFRTLDWQDLLRDRAPRKDLVYRRKQDDRSFLASGGLGIRADDGIVLPLGLVQGQKITQVLRNATMRVADVQDFDKLPTPFRAVATDLENGDAVVLRSGDLATVLRASMSAPGVLAPVEIGGQLLVDGGLVDNLPVDLAKEMGVDVVIAVDVSFPLSRRDGLQTPLDVSNQMIGIMVRRGTAASLRELGPADVLVQPELGRMTAIDFARMPQVMAAGETAVAGVGERLAALAVPADTYQAYAGLRARTRRSRVPGRFRAAGRALGGRRETHRGRIRLDGRASRSTRRRCSTRPIASTDSTGSRRWTIASCATMASAASRSTCGASPGARTSCASA